MIAVFLSLVVVFLILVASELLWNSKNLKGELDRKFVHITVGTFVAFWPFYMSFRSIQLISVAFLAVVLITKKFKIFKAVHTVDRKTWGEALFAVAIGLVALIAQNEWIFMAAILHLSLADGLAAIFGKRLGKGNEYKVLGHTKSVVGTLAFIQVSVIVLGVTLLFGPFGNPSVFPLIIWLPLVAAALENAGVHGLDNVLVPVLIATVLNSVG